MNKPSRTNVAVFPQIKAEHAERFQNLNHPYVFFTYMRLTTSTPYPVGTLVVNLQNEMDDDDGQERITLAGNVWNVTSVNDDDRYIACEATGAAIVPTVLELVTQFILSDSSTERRRRHLRFQPSTIAK